jgi:ADP-heptose:LPS heptosyltransferase
VAQALKEARPDCEVHYVAAAGTAEIARACPFIDGVVVYSERERAWQSTRRLAGELRRLRLDAVFYCRPTPRAALAGLMAGIPLRVGTAYRYYSLLFNRRVREHRKYGDKHESRFNLNLLEAAIPLRRHDYEPRIDLAPADTDFARTFLQREGLRRGGFAVVHPGSGGSARNLPPASYARLADIIELDMGFPLLVTAGSAERSLIEHMNSLRRTRSRVLVEAPGLTKLAAVIKEARLFISGSTGPMHLAATVGTPILAFFPPQRPCSPRRWGPMGSGHTVIMPDVPECRDCTEEACELYDCMDRIGLEGVAARVAQLLAG